MTRIKLSFLFFIFLLVIQGNPLSAQISLTHGGKKLNQGDTLVINQLGDLNLTYSNLKQIDPGLYGRIVVHLSPVGPGVHANYFLAGIVDGRVACEDFIATSNKSLTLYSKSGGNSFISPNLLTNLTFMSFENSQPVIKFDVRIYYQDYVGYEEYGTAVDLTDPFPLHINLLHDQVWFPFAALNAYMEYSKVNEIGIYRSFDAFRYSYPDDLVDQVGDGIDISYYSDSDRAYTSTDVSTEIHRLIYADRLAGMEKLKANLTEYVTVCSNYRPNAPSNPLASYGLAEEKKNPHGMFFRQLINIVYMDKFNKRVNKNYEAENLFQEFKSGELMGYGFSTELVDVEGSFTTNYCYLDLKLVNDPTRDDAILLIYTVVNDHAKISSANVQAKLNLLYENIRFKK